MRILFKVKQFLRQTYVLRRRRELETFSAIENVHDLPQIAHYWADNYVVPLLEPFGFRNCNECFRSYIGRICKEKATSTFFILSVGAGDCATEINIAEWLRENGISNYRFECLDLNADVLKRGRASAEAK